MLKPSFDERAATAAALEPRDLAQLLLEAGLLDRDQLIAREMSILPASQRNHNYFVRCEDGPAYFVKQGVSRATRATVAREATFYESVATSGSEVGKFTPKLVRFLPECCVLVLGLVVTGTNLERIRNSRTAASFFARLGKTMACLHRQSHLRGIPGGGRAPLVSRLGSLSAKDLTTISAAGIELVQTIQQFPNFEATLSEAFPETDTPRLTHNDFRSANCLIGPGRVPVIIDWEFAAIGDPAWDIGCVLADFLMSWLLSMPLGSQVGVERLPLIAVQPIEGLQPAMGAFWRNYVAGRALDSSTSMELLVRATRCAGLKLAQAAYEMCQYAASLTAAEVHLLQLSWNVLDRPVEAIVRLLGIPLEGGPDDAVPQMQGWPASALHMRSRQGCDDDFG